MADGRSCAGNLIYKFHIIISVWLARWTPDQAVWVSAMAAVDVLYYITWLAFFPFFFFRVYGPRP